MQYTVVCFVVIPVLKWNRFGKRKGPAIDLIAKEYKIDHN